MAAIGVHFGYTCACVAIFKDGRAEVVANDAGDRVTPAVVAYRDTEQIVGIAAKQGRVRNAANTVVKVKQVLGRSFEDPEVQTHKAESKCPVVNKERSQREASYEMTLIPIPPPLILHKMKETAQSALGADVTEAVITVPFEFAHAQKAALRAAAEAAGFRVLRLIHEPAAALLAYGIGQDCPSGKRHHLAAEFKRSYKQDVSSNPRAMLKLMNGADMAKHSLSTLGSANCFVDSLHDGMDFDCNISRARFELLCSSLFNKSVQPIRSLLETTGLSTSDINKVVLCGGSARIPRLQQMIKDLFADVELLSSAPPDEVIAVGAAMEAGLLVGREIGSSPESVTVEACVSDILLKEVDETGAEVFSVLLPSGTPLPARRHHILSGPGRLASLCLELYQKTTEQPERLAKIVLRDLETKEDNHDIDAVVTMKRDGSLHVSCVEQNSGKTEAISISAAS
ncbi:heat shock 70 kDa protein 14-like [Oncorhynchus keta]|uniref:heat shock 70 kDa protein 14-like n=1 Tax=Oncorhynchus keta TaxID=8018 RepID=UPI002279FB56|nr:heat shock 70 kDa protein 14-like [Oncorhynchus keta]